MKIRLLLSIALCSLTLWSFGRDFYQLKVYHLANAQQSTQLDSYLEDAYLPALHRAGIPHVGVFRPIAEPETEGDLLVYVFIPYASYEQFIGMDAVLEQDDSYQKAGEAYIKATHDQPPYDRIETILMNAFDAAPHAELTSLTAPKSERVYELRSYEGPTEAYYRNKVDMFIQGDELGLFKKLDFNAIFYGEVIAGRRMPNLMYLTAFENRQSRDDHWDAFFSDPHWKELAAMAKYKNNVSRNEQVFLYPTAYSDF